MIRKVVVCHEILHTVQIYYRFHFGANISGDFFNNKTEIPFNLLFIVSQYCNFIFKTATAIKLVYIKSRFLETISRFYYLFNQFSDFLTMKFFV